ncbi:hypothetical protein MTR67_033660 [Solanum verrucosum]|uniref:PAS domain-containing protein n=1 Tax=Solanum verrucosum TaxID=315347 RepID=A0AAF0U6P7_SOLVR|nr:hypothetical protein MTR67_033660 [Solanum verrucosum]
MVQSELLRNRTAEKLYGYSAAEALGSDLIEFLTDARNHDAANNIVHRVIREADDEADHINLPTTPCNTNSSHFCDSYHEGLDSDIPSQSLNCFLPLPWHGGGELLQPVDTPVVVETSKWSKLTMMKACKALGVNESSFEHEILDIVLRMEEKRKNQIQEQKKVKDSRKGKNKADAELKKLAWGLQEGSGKKDRGRFESLNEDFKWVLSGVYGPHTNPERDELWNELAAIRELNSPGQEGRLIYKPQEFTEAETPKEGITKWNREVFGQIESQRQSTDGTRKIAIAEEISWRQKSRCLWLKPKRR